ncbi:MAG: serine/threonine protein kinase [Ahniella sp.]|nr:serine/threonine protein kinase [Ahniella sp.]
MTDGLTIPPPSRQPKATVTGIFAATDFIEGDVIADRFRIVRLLGMGAMGMVYQAEDQQLNVPVALKLLRPELANKPEFFDRFRQELLLARQVSSPHVVRIHDLVQHQGSWLISMDYVAGESLEDLLLREPRLSPDRALQITRQLALGLAAAHQKGVVHRDLKPANVLLNEQGDALISDFGVARSIGETRLTQSGMVVGTPAYLSPEQAQAAKIDGRSDLYTLGLMLYEMLSGTLPFAQGTSSEMLVQRILRSPPSVQTEAPGTPAWIAALIATLLTPKPEDRIASAEQLIAAIDRRMPPAQMQRRRQLRRLRSILPYAAAGLLLCAVAFAIGIGWRSPMLVAVEPELDDLAILPFGLDDPGPETRDRLRGAERILNAALSDQLVVSDPGKANRAMAQLGLDASTWPRNLPALFTLLPSEHWLELFRETDRGWQLRLWTRDETSPETLLTLPAGAAIDSAALAKLQAAVLARLRIKAPTPGLDLQRLPDDLIRALGDSKSPQPAPGTSPAPLLAIWCNARLSDLETAGERATAQIQARACVDALATSTGRLEKLARIHSALTLEQVDEAIGLSAGLDDRGRLAAHLHARVLADSGDLEAAEHLMRTVGERDASDGRAWFQAGKFAIMRGDARVAVDDYLVRAQVVANRQADAQLRADVANAFGVGFRRLGQLQAAADAYRQGATLQEQAGNARGRATSMQNLSSVLSTLGRFDEAAEALATAESLIRPLGDQRAIADLRNDVGVLAEERGDLPSALAAYREALNMRLQRPDQRSVAESLLNVGFAYYQMGDFANAEVHWQQASERFGREQDLFGTVRAQRASASPTRLAGISRDHAPVSNTA